MAGRPGSSAAVQRNLNSLKKQADGNIINFHNGTCKILQVVGINPRHRCMQVQWVKEGDPPSALVSQVLGLVVGFPQQRRNGPAGVSPVKGHKDDEGVGASSHCSMGSRWRGWCYLAWKKEGSGGIPPTPMSIERRKENGARPSLVVPN